MLDLRHKNRKPEGPIDVHIENRAFGVTAVSSMRFILNRLRNATGAHANRVTSWGRNDSAPDRALETVPIDAAPSEQRLGLTQH